MKHTVVEKMLEKEEFYFRFRNTEIKVYKKGGKILELKSSNLTPSVNRISLNKKAVTEKNKKNRVKNELIKIVEKLYGYGYSIEVKNIEYKYENALETNKKDTEDIHINLKKKLKENPLTRNKLSDEEYSFDKKSCKFLKSSYILKDKDEYDAFLDLWETLINKTIGKERICKKINIVINLNQPEDMSIINNDIEKFTNLCEEILINYDNYIKVKEDIVPVDEKNFQQQIMNLLQDTNSSIFTAKNTPFNKNIIPFELEWVESKNNARIDAIFFDKNKIILCEMKYNEGVIGGTNGLHKHLDDLLSIMKNKNSKKYMINKILEKAKERQNILKEYNKIFDADILGENPEIEYWIICGHDCPYSVLKKELDRVTRNELTIEKETKNKKYKENLSVNDYISKLKDTCTTYIYVVNEKIREFNEYKTK